jgi:serine phosphatase RsbU (regulator of sigma subunit)/PAS domain-containing protein
VLRLAAVIKRQRHEIEQARDEVAAATVIATAVGQLMERLGCSAADAMAQLRTLAEATHTPLPALAATLTATSPADPPGAPAGVTVAAAPVVAAAAAGGSTALGADGNDVAALLCAELRPYGVRAVGMWLLRPGGVLELFGEHDLPDTAVWRLIPPQLDSPAQRVAHGAPDIWWPSGPPDEGPAQPASTAESGHGRAVLALRDRGAGLLGVLELRWPGPARVADDDRRQITALAAGCTRVLAARLAVGDLRAAPPGEPLFGLLDELAGSVLVVSAIRDAGGTVTDFAIDHVSPGYLDPAGRPATEIKGLTLLEAYPVTTAGHGLFARALRAVEDGVARHLPGPLTEPVPIADFRVAKLGDGAVFTWRGYGEPGGLTDLLDHVQRIGRLGGWEENLVTSAVRWTDSAFGVFGLPADAIAPIPLAELHSFVISDDKAVVRRFAQSLLTREPDNSTVAFRIVRPDDSSVRQIRVFAEPVTDSAGTVVALRGAFQDVSAHYLTQVALDVTRGQLADTRTRLAEEHRLALRLQHAIMPPDAHPVVAAGIDIAVRYRPVGRGHLVGGDWYDTLLLPGSPVSGLTARDQGRVLVVVGDVAGHGIEAVTGMVTARNSLRGLAITGAGPAELIGMLNNVLCHLTEDVVGTVIASIYDPGTRVLRWARAGHLPPVLVRDQIARALPLPNGILLGMDPDAIYDEVTTPLMPGDALLLFTDGLIERRNESIDDALTEFVAVASGTVASGEYATADALADRMIASSVSDTQDDACLVAVRISLRPPRLRWPLWLRRGLLVHGRRLGGDPVPGVPRPCPVGRRDAIRLDHHRVGEQLPDPLRQQGRPARRDDDAGGAVHDRVHVAAGRRREHRPAAGHGLQRRDAGRVVRARAEHQVRGPQQAWH